MVVLVMLCLNLCGDAHQVVALAAGRAVADTDYSRGWDLARGGGGGGGSGDDGGGGGGGGGSQGAEAASLAKGLRLPRLLRLVRMVRLVRLVRGPLRRRLEYFLYYSSHASALKLLRLLVTIGLLCHYLACLLFAVAAPQVNTSASGRRGSAPPESYLWHDWSKVENAKGLSVRCCRAGRQVWFRMEDCEGEPCYGAPLAQQYATAFYTVFLLINGEETGPKTDGERLFAAGAILAGSVMVATIFGNVNMIIMSFSADQSAYRGKMESLYENMAHLQLPQAIARAGAIPIFPLPRALTPSSTQPLRHPPFSSTALFLTPGALFLVSVQGLKVRIVDFYDHMWRHYRSLDGSTALFIPELNRTLAQVNCK